LKEFTQAKIPGPVRDEVSDRLRTFHNDELRDLYWFRSRVVGVKGQGAMRAYIVLEGKRLGIWSLGLQEIDLYLDCVYNMLNIFVSWVSCSAVVTVFTDTCF
jgi:hypothetical protein